jgi:tellurium resistance protein TerD
MLNLNKGQGLNLSKSLTKVVAAMGWTDQHKGANAYDLDVTAFLCQKKPDGTTFCPSESYVIFYNQLVSPNNAVIHSADDRTGGDGNSDNETVEIDFDRVNKLTPKVDEILFFVTIFEAKKRGQTLGDLKSAYIRLDDGSGNPIAQYKLNESFGSDTAVQIGSLVRAADDSWEFKAIGAGFQRELNDIIAKLGL